VIISSKQEHMVLNGHNYGMWAQGMETLLKSKKLWYFTKPMVQDPKEELHKFIISGKNDEVIKFILVYISREIHSNTRIINLFESSLEEVEEFVGQDR
jgi:hypothetical protein